MPDATPPAPMSWTLEVVPVPVSDVDAAIAFYGGKLGFTLDHDVRGHGDMRIVQLTPPGSACSIVLGASPSPPGSLKGLQLVVGDIDEAHRRLVERGVDAGDVVQLGDGSRDGERFVFFSDPDGNAWAVQELRSRR